MKKGRFGDYGGQYMPETLMKAVQELESAYEFFSNDTDFQNELNALLKNYAGRPSLLYYAEKMTGELGGAKIYLKEKTSITPDHIRSTTCSDRFCSPNGWGKRESSRKREQDSMV